MGWVCSLHNAEKSAKELCSLIKYSAWGSWASSLASEVDTGSDALRSRGMASRRAPRICR